MESSPVAPTEARRVARVAHQHPEEAPWSRAARLALRLLDVPLVLVAAPGSGERVVHAYPAGVDDDWPAELQPARIGCKPTVKLRNFTTDATSRLRALYAQ